LTTVHQSSEEMIELATHTLIRLLEGEAPQQLHQALHSHLIIRQSTARPYTDR
jgi:DNA-binding LacI/PurR family transcriptional regulator